MNPPTCRTCGVAEWNHLCGRMKRKPIKKAKPEAKNGRKPK